MTRETTINELLESIGVNPHQLAGDVARIEVHENKVLGAKLVPGLEVDAKERSDGIEAAIRVTAGQHIAKPVHICFGVLPEDGRQHIDLDIRIETDADASFLAHCTFPNARDIVHSMNADITVAAGASYSYFERHVHGDTGGVLVVPKAKVTLEQGARFKTEFELIRGRAGKIEFDYECECLEDSVLEMVARIKGLGTDLISIRETAYLNGARARAALKTHIALRDEARAEVYNTLIANAPEARGHVDCKEVVLDQSYAKAVPIVEVNDPSAHVTHEAAIGSVDSRQLQTLMSRGLPEDDAVNLIIDGLLS